MTCTCGLGPSLEACCGRFIQGSTIPETAEALMRSRYTAYVLANVGYLLETHHPDTVDDVDPRSMAAWAKKSTWEGLEIVLTERGGPGDEDGVVEFKARYKQEGNAFTHHERSRFNRLDGRWYYRDGQMVTPEVRHVRKVGRNDPCPCGSGKKHKRCCGAAA